MIESSIIIGTMPSPNRKPTAGVPDDVPAGADDARVPTAADEKSRLTGLSAERAGDLFSGVADLYAAHRPGYPDEVFGYLAGELGLGPDSRVLDVGCGPGTISLPLAAFAGTVVAVDPNTHMLATARTAAQDRGLTGITFHQGRAEDLPDLPIGPVDHALFGRSFHWTDRYRVIDLLDRLLPADGAIVLINPTHGDVVRPRVWDPIVDEIRTRFVGDGREDGDPRVVIPQDRHHDVLLASTFSQLERTFYVQHAEYSIDRVVGLQLTFSYTTPQRLGDRAEEYAAAVRRAVLDGLGEGPYPDVENTEVTVARRRPASA